MTGVDTHRVAVPYSFPEANHTAALETKQMTNVIVTNHTTGEIVGRFPHINQAHRWIVTKGSTSVTYCITKAE